MSSLENGSTSAAADFQEFGLEERTENRPCSLHQGAPSEVAAGKWNVGSEMVLGHAAIATLRLCCARFLLPSCCLALRARRLGWVSRTAACGSIQIGASMKPEILSGWGVQVCIGGVGVRGGGGGVISNTFLAEFEIEA